MMLTILAAKLHAGSWQYALVVIILAIDPIASVSKINSMEETGIIQQDEY